MPTTVDVPLTIQPDAAALVAALGMRAELDQMIDQARRMIPNLRRLVVSYAEPHDTGPEPSVLLEAYWNPEGQPPEHEVWDSYRRWRRATFPPEVLWHFTLLIWEDPNHAR